MNEQSQSDALVDCRILVADASNVALEMAEIDWVESNLRIAYWFLRSEKKPIEKLTMVTQSRMSASVNLFATR